MDSKHHEPLSPSVRWALACGRTHSRAIVRASRWAEALSRRAPWPLVSLSEADLFAAACKDTGLCDWGDEDFRPALRVLLGALENDARLSLSGRLSMRRELVRLLSMRLCLQDELERHPEIGELQVKRPLFIVGLPRTGTTLLHRLLSADPHGRAPLLWELWYPSTSPHWSGGDPRVARTDLTLGLMSVVTPNFSAIHHLVATEPDECFHVMQATFLSAMFGMRGAVHSYDEWLMTQDMGPAYRFYRRVLQRLQWGQEGRRWLLKSPVHLFSLDSLFAAFPDARVVQTHRHPIHAAASCCSMMHATRGLHSDEVDVQQLGAEWMKTWGTAMDRAMLARQSIDPSRIYDLSYDELIADPQGSVRRIYAHFGDPLDPRMAASMDRWLRENPQNKHGEHSYSPERFGLDRKQVERRFAEYCDRFELARTMGAAA
jgi:hypothetical protein